MRLFDMTGFDVVRYLEPRVPEHVTEERFAVRAEWAKAWPNEQVWHLRKRSD